VSFKKILSIETSSTICGITITSGHDFLAMNEQLSPRKHVEILPDLFKKTLVESGLTLNNIDAIAISIGPGSFTGLRIGLGFAKGLAYSHDLPIIPIPTFLSLAYGIKEKKPENGILHSHGDKVFYQEFNWENNIPSLQSKPKIYQLGDITTKKNICFQSNCGPILSPEIIIEESQPSSLNIGLLANHKYDELINFRPYQIVPNYVAKFETKPIA